MRLYTSYFGGDQSRGYSSHFYGVLSSRFSEGFICLAADPVVLSRACLSCWAANFPAGAAAFSFESDYLFSLSRVSFSSDGGPYCTPTFRFFSPLAF